MNWYYANAGQQVGPISEADFEILVRTGTVKADTLVWREGMANWQAYETVTAERSATTTAAPDAASNRAAEASAIPGSMPGAAGGGFICAECGRPFPPEEITRYGAVAVCANCRPTFLQKLREGIGKVGTGIGGATK